MSQYPNSNQTKKSAETNISFFRDNLEIYSKNVGELDTYMAIRTATNDAIKGIDYMLDVGNGGVFDYDVDLIPHILALDLFLDDIETSTYPSHIVFKTGSALEIPESDSSFDGVLMVMLLHHLVGNTVHESLGNIQVAIREAIRVLKPGGKLIIVESCVPEWFYSFEKTIFPLASRLINLMLPHPVTIQYPVELIARVASEYAPEINILEIPKGKWVIQYGYKFPSMLTPVTVNILTIRKAV